MATKPLTYEGSNYFRQRLILATLSGRSVKINRIRSKDHDPGLREFEASFIRLLDKVTNGSRIEVNEAGTGVLYQPGLPLGGNIDHDCNIQRGIGYYLEGLICLAPFCKKPIKAILRGVTSNQIDPSVDVIKAVSIQVLKKFGIDEGLELTVTKRGSPPLGGGEVIFKCPIRRNLRPLQLLKAGKVKRIRGVAFSTRVSPAFVNRMVEGARSVLNNFLTDIYIHTDHMKGPKSGKSPGFGVSLVAETTEGTFLSAEAMSNPVGKEITVPEDLGKRAAKLLMEEIYRGGCVDSRHQGLALLFMALGQNDVSKLQTGPLSPYTIQFLRHMKDFLQIMFKIEAQQEQDGDSEDSRTGHDKILLTCVGVGFSNLSKTIT
ncbi:RNA 3'-terminal phosphate cyclase-like protein [Apostichopus japonicus]|uniref:RNA 3'-terminal phosphate cyclase-like protein n=1 Tax=Stichopus japonicus TaxID=307972 RepID=A0A2G8KUR8_STIJA|nr:RNA 3'-terminal phosphate cyclase-like protein [Apostichopus japonicus]